MKVKRSELAAIAVKKEQYPQDQKAEIAFVGRSNVGKSSLINGLLGRKNLARTSGSPGKTRTINFYDVNDTFRFVDLPGYGYAAVSTMERNRWAVIINEYLHERANLREVFLLLDIRHSPTKQDKEMFEWILQAGFKGYIIATKADKIAKTKVQEECGRLFKEINAKQRGIIFPFSSVKKLYTESILNELDRLLEE